MLMTILFTEVPYCSRIHQKILIFYTQENNVKLKKYLELSFFLCNLADFNWTSKTSQVIHKINSCLSTITQFNTA